MRQRISMAAVLCGLMASSAFAQQRPPEADLLVAVATGDLEKAKAAVAAGADVNRKVGSATPLMIAAMMGSVPVCEYLVSAGADATLKDGDGFTPADLAAKHGHADCAALLKKAAAAKAGEKLPAKNDAPDAPPKPAETPVGPAPADPKPADAKETPAPEAGIKETAEFDDLRFAPPDAKKWKQAIVDNNLVYSSPLPPPDFCTITLYASRDCAGDDDAFKKLFDDLVQADLKAKKTVKIEKDSGPQPAGGGGATILQRSIICEAEDFHTVHFFLAIHSRNRMQLIAYQSSGEEMFKVNEKEANALLSSIAVETSEVLK